MAEHHGEGKRGNKESAAKAASGAAPGAPETVAEGDDSKGKRAAEKVAGGERDEATDRTGRFR